VSLDLETEAMLWEDHNHTPRLARLFDRLDRRTLAIIAFLFGVAVMMSYRPWRQIEVGDPAFYDYIAQSIVRGQIPYRDVVDIKGPGGPYISALAILLAKPFGIRDIIAIRFMNVMLLGLLSAVTYLVADLYLKSRLAATLAFLIPLMPEHFAMMLISGTQPKLPMILFGMVTLLLIAKDKPFWAGACSMLSCLCWQPGLLFTGTAFLICSKYLTSWRDLRALKVITGAALPLAVVLAYFHWKGALGDLWAWTITYNYGVFGPEATKGLGDALQKLWRIIERVFRPDTAAFAGTMIGAFKSRFEPLAGLVTLAMVPVSFVGTLIFTFESLRTKLKHKSIRSPGVFRDALIWPAGVYLAFCVINFQAGPDLIPLFPFIGIFAGWFLVKAGQAIASIGWTQRRRSPVGEWWLPALAVLIVLSIVLVRMATYRVDAWTLQYQDQEFKKLSEILGPDDKIYVHGTAEILVLLNRPNLNPYLLLDWDADNFAGSRTPGDWSAIMNEMESQSPKLVAISRLRAVSHRADLERWVQEHYDKLELFKYERVFIRKQQ
jgi:DolP-mannose mannosyltransferase